YFSVSPGSALPSTSTSVNNESCLVAVTVGAKGARVALVPTECLEFTAVGAAEFFAGSGLPLGTGGCVFDNHLPLLDSTDTVRATAASRPIPTSRNGVDLLFF